MRVVVAALVAVSGAALVAGCSSSGTAGPDGSASATAPLPQWTVAAAYQKTIAAGSAKITVTAQLGARGKQGPADVSASGVIDFSSRTSDLTAQLPDGAGSVEIRYLSGILYAKLPPRLAAKLPGHTAWISVDVDKITRQRLGTSLRQVAGAAPTDPNSLLGYLRGTGQQVRDLGSDTVDNVRTTHYQVTIDLDKVAARAGGRAAGAIKKLERRLHAHTFPAQLWIDRQGRLRRMSITRSGTQVTVTLSHFGTPVHVAAPPAGRTTDLTSLLSGHH